MVKLVGVFVSLLLAGSLFAQNLSMGVGARVNTNFIDVREKFNFDIINIHGDTLKLQPVKNGIKLNSGLSVPIYARYTSKRNWWVQVNYGYEIWRLEINGESRPTDYQINTLVDKQIADLPNSYTEDEIEELRDVYEEDIIEEGTTAIQSFERVEYNKLSFAIGSSLNRKGIITFYYGLGFDFYTPSTFESYQGLIYDNDEVELQHELLEDMPKLESNIISPFANFGIEKQNLRMGLDFTFYPSPAFGNHKPSKFNTTIDNEFKDQLIRHIMTVGVNVNYTLFNQNFNQAISTNKKNILDPLVIGRYRQKPKLLQLGLAFNFPSIHNSGWSVIDDFELPNEDDIVLYNDSLDAVNDNYLSGTLFENDETTEDAEILDYIYLEKQDETIFINDNGEIDTNFMATTVFFDWGNINSILISPKLSGFIRFNPHELFSAELNIGYQNHTYGIVAYETETETIGSETSIRTRKLLYQENFHEISTGFNAYVQKNINNISQLGFHVGLNYNIWLNGSFFVEPGGINDSELLADFHDYFTGQKDDKRDDTFQEAEEWNTNINEDADKGVFTKEDYYNYKYNGQDEKESYHTDFSPYLFNTFQKRSYFDLRIGVDYYIENLKFNLYAERSLNRNRTMYNSLFSVGMGVAMFLN